MSYVSRLKSRVVEEYPGFQSEIEVWLKMECLSTTELIVKDDRQIVSTGSPKLPNLTPFNRYTSTVLLEVEQEEEIIPYYPNGT